MKIVEFVTREGHNPFAEWFGSLDPQAVAKVVVALARVERGNFSSAKSVGGGVIEYRIDWGPGYRIYFGRVGAVLIVLLAGGTKRRQQVDIDAAKAFGPNISSRGHCECRLPMISSRR